jgi:PAS domain S-box-containing protein
MESKEALRQSEERLRIALDAARLGTWQINLQSRQLAGSEICKESFGLEPEMDFLYDDLLATIHPDDRQRAIREFEGAVRNREEYKSEFRVVWRDDSVHWILSRGTVNYLENGKAHNAVGVTLDITERKIAEKQREELLESEQAARAEAESANRLKDEFLATVSHELRTPLNAMLGWTTLLRTGRLGEADAARALETIERNARTQAEIIEDLLDVSRIITGKLNLQIAPIEPAAMVKTAVESLQLAAEAKDITVRQTIENDLHRIMGDAARIQQIVWNLLSNAIKFTPAGGAVEIRLKREASHLAIAVSDNGNGITPEFLPFVFDRFLQADGKTTRTYGGLGLGLAIVRHLVELHGGTVHAESDGEGKGATFTVRLPLAQKTQKKSKTNGNRASEKEARFKNESCDNLTGIKVLVVDDEPDSLELIRVFLEHCGAHVATASSAAEALKHLDGAVPDVLISDIGMPETDGFDLIKKVRGFEPERGGKVPAVALTAYAREEDKQRALHSGFQTHLAKPVEMEELINVVAGVVKGD